MSDLKDFVADLGKRPDARKRRKIDKRPDVADFVRGYLRLVADGKAELDAAFCARWLGEHKAFSISGPAVRRWMGSDPECQELLMVIHGETTEA